MFVIIVLSDSKAFEKGVDYSTSFAVVFGEGLVTSAHDKHRNDRSVFNKYFIRSNVNKSMPMYNEITDLTIDQLLDERLGDKTELELDIEPFFARLALRVFMNYCCGTDYRENLPREEEVNIIFIVCFDVLVLTINLNNRSAGLFPEEVLLLEN